MSVTDLDELAERVDTLVAEQNRTPVLSVIRGLLNETGVRRARAVLMDAPDILGNAQESLRVAQEAERSAQEARNAAFVEAAWLIEAQFVTEGNKTYLVEYQTPGYVDSPGIEVAGQRRAMTADQRRVYVDTTAAKDENVARATAVLKTLSNDVARCRDDVEIAKARLSAAKYELQAAVAELETLRLCLPTKETP